MGNKAANLARLAAHFRVPPGFCVDASVYEALGAAMGQDGAERRELHAIVAAGHRSLAQLTGIPEPLVAVRSSAIGEDGAESSFAGQHETILNVRGIEAVTDAVLDCWRSAASDRATAYRRARGIDAPPRIAVLVQQMVPSDVSAIAFGVDPITQDRTVVVIDAAAGLGDRIASGEVTPDRYVVRKADLTFVERHYAGALSDAEARAIAELVVKLEDHNEGAVDVECAIADGELYLLQCRPVTTLNNDFPIEWRDARDAQLHWRRDDAHFNGPVPRLLGDYITNAAHFGMARRAEFFDTPVVARLEGFNGRRYAAAQPRYRREELAVHLRDSTARIRAYTRGLRRIWDEEWLPHLLSTYEWMDGLDLDHAPLARIADACDELWPRVNEIWRIHMLTVGPTYVLMDEFAETYARLIGGSAIDAFRMTQGLAHSLQRLERDVHRLTELARSAPAVAEGLSSGTITSLDELRAVRGGTQLADAIGPFLKSYGNFGHAGEDMRADAWADDPSLLLAEIGRRLATPAQDPDERQARLIAEGDAIAQRARETLRGRPEDLAVFEEVLAVARAVGPLSEEHNYWLDRQMQSNIGRMFRVIGRRLADASRLERPEDVFHFELAELIAALRDGRDLRDLEPERRAEFARWSRMRAPATIGAPAPPLGATGATNADLIHRARQDDDALIKGVSASGGRHRGAAKLVWGTEDFKKMKPGDVLVCRSSNVSWIPLFTIAGAVVTEVGGALSHAAVVAREFGVPAVVGVGVAFERLRDGMIVEVDGDRGIVRPIATRSVTE
ncbi:MAG TPA: PEP/pyruvate-binding domain-containing protein [Candidatus Limnocylindria bacterium]